MLEITCRGTPLVCRYGMLGSPSKDRVRVPREYVMAIHAAHNVREDAKTKRTLCAAQGYRSAHAQATHCSKSASHSNASAWLITPEKTLTAHHGGAGHSRPSAAPNWATSIDHRLRAVRECSTTPNIASGVSSAASTVQSSAPPSWVVRAL